MPTPTVSTVSDASVTPTTVAAQTAVPTPSVSGDANVLLGDTYEDEYGEYGSVIIAAGVTVPTPSVEIGGDASITAGNVGAVTAVPAPTVTADGN